MGSREEIKNKIIEVLRRESNILLTAPTGWGKTVLAMEVAAELARGGAKVGVFAPTLTLLLLRHWRELLEKHNDVSAILTGGAPQYCAFNFSYPQRLCPRCPLKKTIDFAAPARVSFEELDTMLPEDTCGYWVQERIMSRYSVILGHYGRLHKIMPLVNYVIFDEAHELFLPAVTSWPLEEVARLLAASPGELINIEVIKELLEAVLIRTHNPTLLDRLYSLQSALQNTCWLEDGQLHCMSLRQWPHGVPQLALTATPPPGFPPEGWEKIEIEQQVKPKALVEPEIMHLYRDNYKDAQLWLHLVVRRLRENYGANNIAIFAISSLRRVLEQNLPPNADLYDAWGKMRVGVDLPLYDAALVFWPSLHIAARRRLRAEGRDPDITELLTAIQLAGRILRPADGESYEDVLRRKVIVFADKRFTRYWNYLEKFFQVEPLRL
jgi:hypothetical protein